MGRLGFVGFLGLGGFVGYTIGGLAGVIVGATIALFLYPIAARIAVFLSRHRRRVALFVGAVWAGSWLYGGYGALAGGVIALFAPSLYAMRTERHRCPNCGSASVSVEEGTLRCSECGLAER